MGENGNLSSSGLKQRESLNDCVDHVGEVHSYTCLRLGEPDKEVLPLSFHPYRF